MKIVADLHIHSPYSRAVSKAMTLENLDYWARLKGITVMGTGDFTHPASAEQGLYVLKSKVQSSRLRQGFGGQANEKTRFLLTVEVSSIYSKGGKVRRIHSLIFAPSIEAAEKINAVLNVRGNIKSDGRPILGIDPKDLLKICFDADPRCVLVPAHCLLPSARVHTKDGMQQMQHVKKGDYVYTHQGRMRQVEDVIIHPYRGKIHHVQPWYFGQGLETTPEHPFFAIKTQKHCNWQHGFCRPGCSGRSHCCKKHRARPEHFRPQWIPAENLEVNDVLVFPRCSDVRDMGSFFLAPMVSEMQNVVSPIASSGHAQTVTMQSARSRVFANQIPVNKEFCRLAGYFVAEGSVNGRDALSFIFGVYEQ